MPPRVAYTPQVPRLFSETLRDNILLGLPDRDGRLKRAIAAAVLSRDLPALEQGLETVVGPRGVKLSGGQVQRAAAARMFVREPELLVFDDLSSALDVETELAALGAASPTRARRPCLVVSHRRVALRRADQIVVLARAASWTVAPSTSCWTAARRCATSGPATTPPSRLPTRRCHGVEDT